MQSLVRSRRGLSTPRSPTTSRPRSSKAIGASPAQAAPQTRVRLLAGNGQRVDERRELVLELLRSAGTPALGQLDRRRVGEDLLFTTLDAVEDRLRDRLRSRLRHLEAAIHVLAARPPPHGLHPHT